MERLTACHYSILHVIEKAAGIPANAFAAQSYMPEYLNPHREEVDFVARCKDSIAMLLKIREATHRLRRGGPGERRRVAFRFLSAASLRGRIADRKD